ncbi:MAG: hypothetical protein R3F59_03760 [Myxococcota bacterium]
MVAALHRDARPLVDDLEVGREGVQVDAADDAVDVANGAVGRQAAARALEVEDHARVGLVEIGELDEDLAVQALGELLEVVEVARALEVGLGEGLGLGLGELRQGGGSDHERQRILGALDRVLQDLLLGDGPEVLLVGVLVLERTQVVLAADLDVVPILLGEVEPDVGDRPRDHRDPAVGGGGDGVEVVGGVGEVAHVDAQALAELEDREVVVLEAGPGRDVADQDLVGHAGAGDLAAVGGERVEPVRQADAVVPRAVVHLSDLDGEDVGLGLGQLHALLRAGRELAELHDAHAGDEVGLAGAGGDGGGGGGGGHGAPTLRAMRLSSSVRISMTMGRRRSRRAASPRRAPRVSAPPDGALLSCASLRKTSISVSTRSMIRGITPPSCWGHART